MKNQMKAQPLISIICPVYNAEKTIEKMLDSVLSQEYQNFQLIIVDDLSSDSTPEIIKRYASEDSRILFIQNDSNIGPGPAKNKAIEVADGDFITFIDGDDWIEKDTYALMIKKQDESDADVVVIGYKQDFLDTDYSMKYSVDVLPPSLNGDETPPQVFALLDISKVFSFCWTKLFRTSCIKENNVFFPPIMHSEDFFFNMQVLLHIRKTATIKKALYHYIKPPAKTLTNYNYIDNYFELSVKRYLASKEYCVSENAFDNEIRAFISNTHIKHLSMCLFYNCSPQSNMHHKDRVEFARRILNDENTIEAINYCTSKSRASLILNFFFKTRSPYMLVFLGRLLWATKREMPFIFDKLK